LIRIIFIESLKQEKNKAIKGNYGTAYLNLIGFVPRDLGLQIQTKIVNSDKNKIN
jgi:hypothetical protein